MFTRICNELDSLWPNFFVQFRINTNIRCFHHFFSEFFQFFNSTWSSFFECSIFKKSELDLLRNWPKPTLHVIVCVNWQYIHVWQLRSWFVFCYCHFHLFFLWYWPLLVYSRALVFYLKRIYKDEAKAKQKKRRFLIFYLVFVNK